MNYKIKNGKYDIVNRLQNLKEQYVNYENEDVIIDSVIVKQLCLKAEKLDTTNWKIDELRNAYLIDDSEILNFKHISTTNNIKEKIALKELKKQVNQVNNQPSKWRSFPITISRPLYSDDGNYALIIFKYGNNGGAINMYRLNVGQWIFAGYLDKWSY